jgi:hypothetical protein
MLPGNEAQFDMPDSPQRHRWRSAVPCSARSDLQTHSESRRHPSHLRLLPAGADRLGRIRAGAERAARLADLRLYRAKFGLHLFGDAEYFVYAEKYTLRPLQQRGEASLFCRDIGGMEAVWLNDIEYAWPGEDHDERHRSNDVFHALAIQHRRIEPAAEIKKAVFSVRMQGETKLRSVLIRPRNIAEYGRGEEAAIIENWLRARGFVVVGAAADDERPGPCLAVA